MEVTRRDFLRNASFGAACLAAGPWDATGRAADAVVPQPNDNAYKYRVAFGAWINDMRIDPLPLENWPAPQFDDETIRSTVMAMDVQQQAGFNYLDAFGLFATTSYPLDIVSAFSDPDRRRRVQQLIAAGKERGIKLIFGMGLLSWGYDLIISSDTEVKKGSLPHAMCGVSEKSWSYVEKILDCALSEFDFGGVHLESADQGWCDCPDCAGKYGVIGYNVRINTRAADYIKNKWPDKIVTSIPINWLNGGTHRHFNDEEKAHLVELSKHIDCFMDMGHRGTYVAADQRRDFIPKLHCSYGTSGGAWLYHDVRWDRSSYFLPYPKTAANGIKQHYQDGARGSMIYQGPVTNPGAEMNIAVAGRILCNTNRTVEDALAEAIDLYYKPKSVDACNKLADIFLRADDAYCGQWDPAVFEAQRGKDSPWAGPPGEFYLNEKLYGQCPGAATYLLEPYLNANGREAYKKGLIAVLRDLPGIENSFDDRGRIAKIKRGIIITLNLINTIRQCKGEPW